MDNSDLTAVVHREGIRTRLFVTAVFFGNAVLLVVAIALRLWFW